MRFLFAAFVATWLSLLGCERLFSAPRGADGQLKIEVVDAATGTPIPARMHLQNVRKRPVKLNLPNSAELADHFYIDGTRALPLRRGQFTFEIDAGPEYRTQNGHFEIERHADDSKQIEMTRFADLEKEGWYGADLDFNRRESELPLILRAEHLRDVQLADFATFLGGSIRGKPAKRNSNSEIDNNPQSEIKIAPTPFAWDLPVWLAMGEVDAINLIHRHSLREGVVDDEGDSRPRDESLYPGLNGNGRWSEAIYYHVLNCGLRIPPVAGSGSGDNDNPVGTNRIYVFCGEDDFSPQRWWEGLQEGRVFVTNGPLLRPVVEGHAPGYVFHLDAAGSSSFEIGLNLATRVPVEYLEIIKDGQVYTDVRLSEFAQRKGRLPPVEFDASGWFLVRAVTTNPKTYQLASSGPYYVEEGGATRVSKRSVTFFLDWINAAERRIEKLTKLSDDSREAMLAEQANARKFFQQLMSAANAE